MRTGILQGLLVGLFITAMVCPVGSALAQKANPLQEDLKGLGKNLAREQRLLKRLRKESNSLLQTLGELDGDLQQAEREREQALANLARLEKEAEELQQQRDAASRSLGDLRRRLRRRLRRIYMDGRLGWLNLLFSAGTVSDAMQRADLLRMLARQDRRLMAETRRSRNRLEASQRRLKEQRVELERSAAEVIQRRQQAEAARTEKIQALELLGKKKALHLRAMRELRRSRGKLVKLVATIGGRKASGRGFASWRGRLPAPVAKARVEVGFGRQVDKRFKTVTIHKGVDLRARKGASVKAVYPGQVAFASDFQGYGLLVILQHGGGYYTLYGHLGDLKVSKGQKVKQGQALGGLGDTGSLKGPYLYFEIRQGGEAVDPEAWVRFGA